MRVSLFANRLYILTFLLFFSLNARASDQLTAKIRADIYDPSYHFNHKAILFTLFDVRQYFGQDMKYTSSFGAIDPATGRYYFRCDVPGYGSKNVSAVNALQVNHDNTYNIYLGVEADSAQKIVGKYFHLDKDLNILDVFQNMINPDKHGICILRNNKVLYISNYYTTEDFSAIGGPRVYHTLSSNIVEYDPVTKSNDTILDMKERLTTGFAIKENLFAGEYRDKEADWLHVNSIYEDNDGDILISTRHLGLAIIDTTGEIGAWFGIPDSFIQKRGLPGLKPLSEGDYYFRRQHDFQRIQKGPYKGYYTLYDNGDPTRNYSRVPVLDIDKKKGTIKIVKEYFFPFSPFMGSVDFLDDGTFLVNVPNLRTDLVQEPYKEGDTIDYSTINGSVLYWMKKNGDTIARFSSSDINYIYSARVIDIPAWNGIECVQKGEQWELTATGNPEGVSWYKGAELLGKQNSILAEPGTDYYYTFKKGITTGYAYLPDRLVCKKKADKR